MFSQIKEYKDDPIEALQARLKSSSSTNKLDLGVGIYRDGNGEIVTLRSVRAAEQRLVQRADDKGYRSPMGNASYLELMENMYFQQHLGSHEHAAVASIQTPGAGAACRIGAEFIKRLSPDSRIWASLPNWGHQIEFFANAGMEVKYYPYYDVQQSHFQFEEMMSALDQMRAGDVLLLHGCCHNPTGQDPDLEQWRALGELCAAKGVLPFVDIAYQGYGDGVEEDLRGMQLMATLVPEMIVVVSSSKSFTIYRERAGMLSLLSNEKSQFLNNAHRMLRDVARGGYFMPPDHGAQIVAEILGDEQLTADWRQELDDIRVRIYGLRTLLRDTIESADPEQDASYLVQQKGMFSCLPLSAEQQHQMEERFDIFMLPNARINFAALAQEKADRVVEALMAVKRPG
jgi:aspartate aminotransferase